MRILTRRAFAHSGNSFRIKFRNLLLSYLSSTTIYSEFHHLAIRMIHMELFCFLKPHHAGGILIA
jgi:hypothetical protein